jgi:hypothetical protein
MTVLDQLKIFLPQALDRLSLAVGDHYIDNYNSHIGLKCRVSGGRIGGCGLTKKRGNWREKKKPKQKAVAQPHFTIASTQEFIIMGRIAGALLYAIAR